jgi:hypothetical protein
LTSVFPAHAPSDSAFARQLGAFIESGCDAICFTADAAIKPRRDLLSTAEEGLSADVLILLLSAASSPRRWPREIWEPILFAQASETGTRVAILLLEDCVFPELFRRKLKFFDARADRLAALRRLRRWIGNVHRGGPPDLTFSADLDTLYLTVADKPGVLTATGAFVERFAQEAAGDFEAVLWVPARGQSIAQVAGELGSQLGMSLDGPLEENCERIRAVLAQRRCLVVFDAPDETLDALMPAGRTSFLITTEPVRIAKAMVTLSAARQLVVSRRFAEAYEMLRQLFQRNIETESCARELVWICDHWGRYAEAGALRNHFRLPPSEQLSLF